MDAFKQLRIAATMESLYQEYRRAFLAGSRYQPAGRRWMARSIMDGVTGSNNSPAWVADAHPDLYADLR